MKPLYEYVLFVENLMETYEELIALGGRPIKLPSPDVRGQMMAYVLSEGGALIELRQSARKAGPEDTSKE